MAIVVALQQQCIQLLIGSKNTRGDTAAIGKNPQSATGIREDKLTGFAGIVWHSNRLNRQGADLERIAVGMEQTQRFQVAAPTDQVSSTRHPYRQAITPRQCTYAANMITMFMGDQDRIQACRLDTADTQTRLQLAR